jgi:hypothetical protein
LSAVMALGTVKNIRRWLICTGFALHFAPSVAGEA